jgi:hypothetical protein
MQSVTVRSFVVFSLFGVVAVNLLVCSRPGMCPILLYVDAMTCVNVQQVRVTYLL